MRQRLTWRRLCKPIPTSACNFVLAVALAFAGRVEEATPIVDKGLELEPGFRMGVVKQIGLATELVERMMEGARLAGVPE